MTVVSNSSPIINLDAIGHLGLLRGLYDDLLIPPAVHDEVTAAPGKPGAKAVQTEEWITRRFLSQTRLASALLGELDPGEAEAIALAAETEVELLLIDEQAGRRAARRLEVDHVGTLGVLLDAKHTDRVPAIRLYWMHSALRPAFGSAICYTRKRWSWRARTIPRSPKQKPPPSDLPEDDGVSQRQS